MVFTPGNEIEVIASLNTYLVATLKRRAMKITLSEIDSIIERRSQWTRHREAIESWELHYAPQAQADALATSSLRSKSSLLRGVARTKR